MTARCMGEVAETKRDSAQVVEAAVDRLDRTVGCPVLEIGQDLFPTFPEAVAELSKLRQLCRETGFDAFQRHCQVVGNP